jgi:hypothetical protein
MGYKPIIRENDLDDQGHKSIPSQFVLLLDEQGNVRSSGEFSVLGGIQSGSFAGYGATSIDAGGPSTAAVGGGVSMSGGTVLAVGGGGIVEVNANGGNTLHTGSGGGIVNVNENLAGNSYHVSPSGGFVYVNKGDGDNYQQNSAGGEVTTNLGGDTPIFINSPNGESIDCVEVSARAATNTGSVNGGGGGGGGGGAWSVSGVYGISAQNDETTILNEINRYDGWYGHPYAGLSNPPDSWELDDRYWPDKMHKINYKYFTGYSVEAPGPIDLLFTLSAQAEYEEAYESIGNEEIMIGGEMVKLGELPSTPFTQPNAIVEDVLDINQITGVIDQKLNAFTIPIFDDIPDKEEQECEETNESIMTNYGLTPSNLPMLLVEGWSNPPEEVTWRIDKGPGFMSLDEDTGKLYGIIGESNTTFSITISMIHKRTGVLLDTRKYRIYRNGASSSGVPAGMVGIMAASSADSLQSPLANPIQTGAYMPPGGRTHKGIDLRARTPTNVGAAAPGVVKYANTGGGFGRTVVIKHTRSDGSTYSTLYGHLSSYNVENGDIVNAGDVIGKTGTSGASCKGCPAKDGAYAPHLHYEIAPNSDGTYSSHVNSKKINPKGKLADGSGIDPHEGHDHGGGEPEAIGPCPPRRPAAENGGLKDPTPSQESVIEQIHAELDKRTDLTQEDKDHILYLARLESDFDPNAYNKSSATGLFQFKDEIVQGPNGYPHDRTNIQETTNAMADFLQEQKRYESNFHSSGYKSFGKGKEVQISNGMGATYAAMPKGERMYALFHGNGVGASARHTNGGQMKGFSDHYRKYQ